MYNLDIDKSDNIVKRFKILAYPTFVVLDANTGKELVRSIGGAWSVKAFMDKMKGVADPSGYYEAREERLKNDPSSALEYVEFLNKQKFTDKADKVLRDYFTNCPISETFDSKNHLFYTRNVKSMLSPILLFMLENNKECSKAMGEKGYNEFIASKAKLIKQDLSSRSFSADKFNKILNLITKYPILESDIYHFAKNNKEVYINKDVNGLFGAAKNYMKKGNNKGKSNIIYVTTSFVSRGEKEKYKQQTIDLYETAIKHENNVDMVESYKRSIDYIKNPDKQREMSRMLVRKKK